MPFRTASTLNASKKVVLSVNDILGDSKSLARSKCDKYQFGADQINVIVGGTSNVFCTL